MEKKVLVIEDDVNIAELLRLYLEKEGFSVSIAHDGGAGVTAFEAEKPDLVLLDIMLPVMDGWGVLKEIRSASKIPVIMLTAKSGEYDKVLGLDSGADDYVTKPFSIIELISRIKAVLRRSEKAESDILSAGGIDLDKKRHTVYAGGEEVVLTFKEFELLRLMMQNKNIVLERDRLLTEIWGYDFDGETRTIDVHIRTLRSKLGDAGACIRTVRGVGYNLEDK